MRSAKFGSKQNLNLCRNLQLNFSCMYRYQNSSTSSLVQSELHLTLRHGWPQSLQRLASLSRLSPFLAAAVEKSETFRGSASAD